VLGGAVGVAVAELALFTSNPETSVIHVLCQSLANFGLAMALLAVAFIDAEHMIVPDPITIGGTLLALATPGLRDLSWSESFAGALVGFVGIWLPFVFAYRHLRGRPGMGLGDAKLLMLAGAWFGWRGAAFALFAGAAQATIAALAMLTMHGRIEEPEAVRADRQALEQAAAEGDAQAKELLEEDPLGSPPGEGFMAARMPFGPFLCLAMIEWMLAGEWIARRVQWLAV
jgi:leader peptidase (prepilin peptidase)/N-methyltransferase